MQLKLNSDGSAVVIDGKPVYVYENGDEVPFDAPQTMANLKRVNDEAKNHRLKFKEVNDQFDEYKKQYGDLNLEEAKKAIGIVKALDEKELLKASEVDRLKEKAMAAFQEEKQQLVSGHQRKLEELTGQVEAGRNTIRQMMLKDAFTGSEWFSGDKAKTVYAPWEAYEIFGKYFKIEGEGVDARPVGYLNGEKIMSRENYVDAAKFDEAIGQIIQSDQGRFSKILATNGGGGGGGGNQNNQGGGRVVKRGDSAAFMKNLADIASGKVKVQ